MKDILDEIAEMLDENRRDFEFGVKSRPTKLRMLGRGVIEPPEKSFIQSPRKKNELAEQGVSEIDKNSDDKAKFSHFTLTLPASSTISVAEYYPKREYLIVSFKNGGSYSYTSVPFDVVKSWMNAGSAGSFFYYNIRMSFSYRKM